MGLPKIDSGGKEEFPLILQNKYVRKQNPMGGPDMINNSKIYQNPIVPNGFYYMQVISIQQEPATYLFPKLLITLKPHRQYGMEDRIEFASILHPTQASYWHYKHFFNCFMLGDPTEALDKAIGQWGSVKLEQSKYGETVYSAVKFVHQPLPVRMHSSQLSSE